MFHIAAESCAIVVAVDGPSGSGKSSVSRAVATQRGLRYLDTGAMYRAAALAALRINLDLTDASAVAGFLDGLELSMVADPQAPDVLLGGRSVEPEIREQHVTNAVSAVSAIPSVRSFMVAKQRAEVDSAQALGLGIIVEGRDIGTTVLPNADVKVFLTADTNARAQRRTEQDLLDGRVAEVANVEASLEARDRADSTRDSSPLQQANDAIVIDATFLNFQDVVAELLGIVDSWCSESQ